MPAQPGERLPLLPGFREMALRRMAAQRRRLVMDLTAERQTARLSQTEVAARMGTSQSAVARLESGESDARASTLQRYAAAIGCQITWRLRGSAPSVQREEPRITGLPVPASLPRHAGYMTGTTTSQAARAAAASGYPARTGPASTSGHGRSTRPGALLAIVLTGQVMAVVDVSPRRSPAVASGPRWPPGPAGQPRAR